MASSSGNLVVSSVESILVASEVDLDRRRQVATKDGIERWKIELPSKKKKNAIMKGLRGLVLSHGGKWKPGEEIRRNGDLLHLVDLKKRDGGILRLIFVVKAAKTGSSRVKQPVARSNSGKDKRGLEDSLPFERPTIAIILDDIGQKEVDHLKPVLDLKYPITFAVIPFLPYSAGNAVYLHQNNYEVMLHMPMEPDDFPRLNPGEGAIFSHLNDREIRSAIARALKNVPFVQGVNNHMGSKITSNRTLMRPFLEELKKRDLFFIDSRTNSNTVAHKLALEMAMRTARRDVFLDSEMTYDFAIKQLKTAREVADDQGVAIVIGHPYPTSLRALVEELPQMDREGYRFVFASEMIKNLNGRL